MHHRIAKTSFSNKVNGLNPEVSHSVSSLSSVIVWVSAVLKRTVGDSD